MVLRKRKINILEHFAAFNFCFLLLCRDLFLNSFIFFIEIWYSSKVISFLNMNIRLEFFSIGFSSAMLSFYFFVIFIIRIKRDGKKILLSFPIFLLIRHFSPLIWFFFLPFCFQWMYSLSVLTKRFRKKNALSRHAAVYIIGSVENM